MRAMVMPQFGGPDLFEERDVERPHPGPGEILVRVVAAETNLVNAKLGASGDARGLEAPIILGADISGVVEEVGAGVADFAAGDEVYYTPETSGPGSNGSYTEYLVRRLAVRVGERVLIHGGAGGVGSFVVHIAKASEAREGGPEDHKGVKTPR